MLTDKQIEAASLIGQRVGNARKIAARIGVPQRTLAGWRKIPEFQAAIANAGSAWRDWARRHGIGDPDRRLFRSNERWRKLQRVIRERAHDPETRTIPGGKTGLIVKQYKALPIGDGQYSQVLEGALDTGLLAALRAEEIYAATHEGQWRRKLDVKLNGKLQVQQASPLVMTLAKLMSPAQIAEIKQRFKALEQADEQPAHEESDD